jgi:ABC-type transport system involved in cytochrome c biogenesis permease subunit
MSFSKKLPATFLALFLFCGIYICFLSNKWAQASFFDFFKEEKSNVNLDKEFDLDAFSQIPVLRGGRVKPLDSVARNILLVLRNKRSALRIVEETEQKKIDLIVDKKKKEGADSLSEQENSLIETYSKLKIIKIPQGGAPTNAIEVNAIDWLAQVLFHPEKADKLKTFLIDHDQVLGLLNRKLLTDGKFYSYQDLEPFLSNIDAAARKAGEIETKSRDSFQQNIIELYRSLIIYKKLKHSLSPPSPAERPDMLDQLGVADLIYDPERDQAKSDEYLRFRSLTVVKLGSEEFAKVVFFIDRYNQANLWTEFLPIPPVKGDSKETWMKVSESLVGSEPLDSKEKQNMDPARFATILRELLTLDSTTLKKRIEYIRENQKLDGAALFASQYAEAIKVRKGVDPTIILYEKIGQAYREGNAKTFNSLVQEIRTSSTERAGEKADTLHFEKVFNGYEPFYRSAIAYVVIFILACLSWLFAIHANGTKQIVRVLRNSAYYLTIIVLLSHTFGLAARMYIEGRPPVTNLYSSALFIGWGAVLLCLGTEKYVRLGIASAMGALIGFGSLVIAHSLSLDSSLNPTGDTMEMMRAVLDSNFWLATHVVCITIGYSTTFLGGFLGIAYAVFRFISSIIPRGSSFGKTLQQAQKETNRTLGSMIFGITCFSLFFSLVGTILGGIWADQSWGRFWGWDAKENGALLIVIWNALILHARLSGIAKICGIATLAIFGNIVTAWSWFGTNMLGVGLHSYGFMDKAFNPLMWFFASQLFFIALAYISPLFRRLIQIFFKNA